MEKQVLFFRVCYYSGLLRLGRWLMQQSGRRLIILNYHRASGGDLRAHMLYLRRHYRMMHLEEALQELYTPCRGGGQMHDQRTQLVLTFDDGYRDNYTCGFTLARELQVPITVFLVPGYIESGKCFWWLEGDHLVRHAQVDEVKVEGCTYHLEYQEDRKALVQAIYTRVCHARSIADREAFLGMVRKVLAVPSEVTFEGGAVLSWKEVREMEESGWVSFGAHTMHHPVLGYMADPKEMQCEVSDCRAVLEQELGHPIRTFAYPLGRSDHIGEEALQAVQDAGYEWAATTIYGINTPQSDPLQLRRIVCDVKWHWLLIAAETSGLRKFFSPLFHYARVLLSVGERIVSFAIKTAGARKSAVKR